MKMSDISVTAPISQVASKISQNEWKILLVGLVVVVLLLLGSAIALELSGSVDIEVE
jgi:hypothetical protein